jgi:hypothetical protein
VETNAKPAGTGTVGPDVLVVASLRLPVGVQGLEVITDCLRKQYGSGLTMRQQGDFLLVEKPNAEAHGRRSRTVHPLVRPSESGGAE